MNFIVQSIANMISIYNITSYPDDSCFNKKKNSFIMIYNYVKNETISQ